MLCRHVFHLTATQSANHRVISLIRSFHSRIHQFSGHDVVFILPVNDGIFKVGPQADGVVRRQGPSRSGPDHEIRFGKISAHGRQQPFVVFHGKFHIDGLARIIGIFDFRFGQSRFAATAPINGF